MQYALKRKTKSDNYIYILLRYEGKWAMDKKYGYGVLTLADGSMYEGNFRANHRHGLGKITYSDGRVEEGLFSYGVLVSSEEFEVNLDELVNRSGSLKI